MSMNNKSVPFYLNDLNTIEEDSNAAAADAVDIEGGNNNNHGMEGLHRLNSARLNEFSNMADVTTITAGNSIPSTTNNNNNSIPLVDVKQFWNDPLVKNAKKEKRFAAPSDISSTKGIQAGYMGGNSGRSMMSGSSGNSCKIMNSSSSSTLNNIHDNNDNNNYNNNYNNNNNKGRTMNKTTKKTTTAATTTKSIKSHPSSLTSRSSNTSSNNNKGITMRNILTIFFGILFCIVVVVCFLFILQLSNSGDDSFSDDRRSSNSEGRSSSSDDGDNKYNTNSNNNNDDHLNYAPFGSTYQKRIADILAAETGVATILHSNFVTNDNDSSSATTTTIQPQLDALKWLEFDPMLGEATLIMFPVKLLQRYVLLVLYFSTNGPDWVTTQKQTTNNNQNNAFPNKDISECLWPGVTCRQEQIIYFNMKQFNITGPLPIEIGWLPFLRKINLEENAFTGSIHDQFFHALNYLEKFDISNNQLSGTIPSNLWTLPNIKLTFLNDNQFNGNIWNPNNSDNNNDIATTTTTTTATGTRRVSQHLKQIWLQNNQLTGNLPTWINGDVVPQLEHLIVSNNKLSGHVVDNFFESTELWYASLSSNQFSGPLPRTLFTNCQDLFLNDNQFTGTVPRFLDIDQIPTELEKLYLNDNQLSGTIPADGFGSNWPNIQELLLQGNDQLSGTIPCGASSSSSQNNIWQVGCNISCSGCCNAIACP